MRQFRACPIGSLLNERQLANKAFNNARRAAAIILEQIGYRIRKVSNIEIRGKHVYQEERLEEEIEDEFNQGEDSNEDRLSSGEEDEDEIGLSSEDNTDSTRQRLDQARPIEIAVVFEVRPVDESSSSRS